uniref:Rad4 beta-hairpin domain-containing protein n=1 Tax=Heliothis virescens TaxID=7102 RepID=A0A2A4JDF4_HELVI
MPTTRKKVIKTVYKDEDSEAEDGDFSDSGSDAKISAEESSSDEEVDAVPSSGDEFDRKNKAKSKKAKITVMKPKFTKHLLGQINKQDRAGNEEDTDIPTSQFSVKDLTDADKLLPSILNLSESDSSDDESPNVSKRTTTTSVPSADVSQDSGNENDVSMEYQDVWSNNIQENSEEIAQKAFLELEKHKSKIEETKASVQKYTLKVNSEKESDVKDLLAMGEEVLPEEPEEKLITKKPKVRKRKDDSESEIEDWEEVKESKGISQQGIQLFVEFPDAASRRERKKIDVEMMMKRKINRVKKEYQIYMHKVHVLCWLGHGNYVSGVLNDQELMAAVLALVPSKECYPGERVDMKYVEQITTWYKDKLTLKQDKHEDKFKPKAPPLKTLLLEQIKNRVVTTKKYLVFIFIIMLRALGLQCRVMFNFVVLPLKPPSSELCSLATKPKKEKSDKPNKTEQPKSQAVKEDKKDEKDKQKAGPSKPKAKKPKIAQVDGNDDSFLYSDDEYIMQVDGSDDTINARKARANKRAKAADPSTEKSENEDVSPPKLAKTRAGRAASPKQDTKKVEEKITSKKLSLKGKNTKEAEVEKDNMRAKTPTENKTQKGKNKAAVENNKDETKKQEQSRKNAEEAIVEKDNAKVKTPIKSLTRRQKLKAETIENSSEIKEKSPEKNSTTSRSRVQRNNKTANANTVKDIIVPKLSVTDENAKDVASKYFEETKPAAKTSRLSRKRSQTTNPDASKAANNVDDKSKGKVAAKGRTKSAPGAAVEKSKYFEGQTSKDSTPKRTSRQIKKKIKEEDSQRVSHRDLAKPAKGKGDVTKDLVNIIKSRVKDAKLESKKGLVKGKIKKESDEDSDYLPVEDPKRRNSESDDDFKPTKISPKPSTSRRIDRRVLSSVSSEDTKKNRTDVWCEIFVEELEQWISVDVIKGKVHSSGDLYNNATHPVCYIVGWDNNNYLKDLTRKYVPHWNTVTRKVRAESPWWDTAIRPWLGPKTARDKEEDEYLDRMQLEAPLPKSITEYKNHPLYALKRHLLKFEALYPPDAAVLGFVRNEPVYARECVYTCRSRDVWLKEAKVVRLGEKPYKIVKARPKWDKLSNKLITDKPLEIFGPWQVQDYEPPTAENGIVPRNAYGNVELFKACMLPKKTVHIKLPGLNRVAKKLNIDCAPAMTGFDFNGGWSHPVYDGFVVCEEFEEIITEAWVKDQEEQERKELEKIETRVYGNWKRLIKGLLIRERLKNKYGFEEPSTSETTKKSKGPRLVVKKKS